MLEKKALTREISKQYQKAEKKEKIVILNKLVKTTGYNRKYVLYVPANLRKLQLYTWPGKLSNLRFHQ